jgi:hypothetical protein
VGAPDLHHRVEDPRPVLQRRLQPAQRRQQVLLQRLGRGQVHGAGEDVVGRLPPVDVVVGVHGRLAPPLASQSLDGPVGDHLVGVHVAGGPRAGLEDVDRELVIVFPVRDLLGRGHDGVGDLRGQVPLVAVDLRGRPLDEGQGPDQPARQAPPADREVLHRPLGLRPPEGLGGHRHLAQGVLLLAKTAGVAHA